MKSTVIIAIFTIFSIFRLTLAQFNDDLVNGILLKQLFARDAPLEGPEKTLGLLKDLKLSLAKDDRVALLSEDIDNLIEASNMIDNKCKPDLFNEYMVLLRHVDPKTFRYMLVLDYYNGAPWNELIMNYLKHYHEQQFKLCQGKFGKSIENVSGDDLRVVKKLAEGMQNNSTHIFAFPFIEPNDIERAVLFAVKAALVEAEINSRELLMTDAGKAKFEQEIDKVDHVCERIQNTVGDHVQFAQQAYYSYQRDKVDSLLVEWGLYSDMCDLIRATSEEQKSDFLETLAKKFDN